MAEVAKGQGVRLLDVLALGPFMMWAGSRRELPEWARVVLWGAGLLTVVYNWSNYQAQRQREMTG